MSTRSDQLGMETASTEPASVRGPTQHSFDRRQVVHETKMSLATTEFWAMLAGLVALVIVYNAADDPSLTLWRTCLLATLIAVAYIVSRGLAKSGSSNRTPE